MATFDGFGYLRDSDILGGRALEIDTPSLVITGSVRAPVLIAGHSNVNCFAESVLVDARDDFKVARSVLNGGYWDFVLDQSVGSVLVFVWNGNQFNSRFLFRPDPDFRLWRETPETTPRSSVLVPEELVRAWVRPSLARLRFLIRSALEGDRRVVILGTPPPKSEEWVAAALPRETVFVEKAKELGFVGGSHPPISRLSFRLALWEILQEEMHRVAWESGARFLAVSEEARDRSGALRPEMCSLDVTHANAQYARMMMTKILTVLVDEDWHG